MSDVKRVEMRSPIGIGVVNVPEAQVEAFEARGFSAVKRQARKSKAKADPTEPTESAEVEPEADPTEPTE